MSELGRQLVEGAGLLHWTLAMEKQVGARVAMVMGDKMLLSAFERFGAQVFRRSSIFHGLAQFLVDNKISGECCLEIGTWNGLTAAVLSRHFRRVVTLDIAHNAIKHEILDHLGIKNVECVDIEGNEDKPVVMENLRKRGLIVDCAYLDGNHAEDTEEDWALTRDCCRVLFHEVWPFQSPVWGLVHSLPQYQVKHGGFGLALWDGSLPPPPGSL